MAVSILSRGPDLPLQDPSPMIIGTQPRQSAHPSVFGSLLFSLDVPGTPETATATRAQAAVSDASDRQLRMKKERIAHYSKPQGKFEQELLKEVCFAKKCLERDSEDGEDVVMLASKMCTMGFNIVVRKGVSERGSCFSNLSHEFLLVRGEGDWAGVEFVVEPRFRDHFYIPHPTPAYQLLLDCLPTEFVGSTAKMMPIIQDLTTEMATSFETQGLTMPPWRRARAMMSKWAPARKMDTSFASFGRSSLPLDSSGGGDPPFGGFARLSVPEESSGGGGIPMADFARTSIPEESSSCVSKSGLSFASLKYRLTGSLSRQLDSAAVSSTFRSTVGWKL